MLYKKNEGSDSGMCPEIEERKPMLDNLTEVLDGMWVIGFNRKTGKPFASATFKDPVCADALTFFKGPLTSWMDEQSDKFEKDLGLKRV